MTCARRIAEEILKGGKELLARVPEELHLLDGCSPSSRLKRRTSRSSCDIFPSSSSSLMTIRRLPKRREQPVDG